MRVWMFALLALFGCDAGAKNTCKTTSDCPGGKFCTQGVCSILLTGVNNQVTATGPTDSPGTGATGETSATGATGATGSTGETGSVICGGVGEACCASFSCSTGNICDGTTCTACGGMGEPCCSGSTCNLGGRCGGATCNPCGAPGQVCCDQGTACERLVCGGGNLCPPVVEQVQVTHPSGGTYGIDKYEVTRAEYAAWLNTAPSTAEQPADCAFNTSGNAFLPGDAACVNAAAACASDSCPQTCVDWCDARAYCAAVGKRLCGSFDGTAGVSGDVGDHTKQQWFNACSNGGTTPYSTGSDAGTCHTGGFGQAAPVGVDGCVSSVAGYEGVFDLNGNVFEWTDLCYGANVCYALGGNFNEDAPYETCAAPPNVQVRTGRFTGVGFRCCSL